MSTATSQQVGVAHAQLLDQAVTVRAYLLSAAKRQALIKTFGSINWYTVSVKVTIELFCSHNIPVLLKNHKCYRYCF